MKTNFFSICKRFTETSVNKKASPILKCVTKGRPITDFLKCPISGNGLKIDEETGGLTADYIFYKKERGIFLLVEEKSEIRL